MSLIPPRDGPGARPQISNVSYTCIMKIRLNVLVGVLLATIPGAAAAAEQTSNAAAQQSVQDTGVSAMWILANISYAGMRAQGSRSRGWRIVAFLFGFPGTLLSYFLVSEGKERAYGIDIVKKKA